MIIRADGTRVEAVSGDSVFQGDVLETGDNGAIGIIFIDETTFSLGANGRMVLDELIYDPDTQSGSSTFSLVQGVFSFVSGSISKTGVDAMTIKTPVATIGIRGTAGSIDLPEGEQLTVVLTAEPDGVQLSRCPGSELPIRCDTGHRLQRSACRNILHDRG